MPAPAVQGLPSHLLGELALSRATLDRADVLRTDEAALADLWSRSSSRVLLVSAGEALVVERDEGPELVLHPPEQAHDGDRVFLGREGGPDDDGGTAYFAVRVPALARPTDGSTRAAGLRELGPRLGARDAGLFTHAVAVLNWHATHTHCPRCGAPTVASTAGHLRRCTVDGNLHYPRTDPAVIMAVVDDEDRLLLGHQAAWPAGRFSTLAGFVEPGESLEMAVVREVAEESGIVVDRVSYAGSQPWPFPASLMLGFFAHASNVAIDVDGLEISDARWFTRAELHRSTAAGEVLLPPAVSIARRLIEGWYGGPVPEGGDWEPATE